jgi:hypothetical protein
MQVLTAALKDRQSAGELPNRRTLLRRGAEWRARVGHPRNVHNALSDERKTNRTDGGKDLR